MAVRIDAAGDYLLRSANVPTSTSFTLMFWMYLVEDRDNYGIAGLLVNAAGTNYKSVRLGSDGTTLEVATHLTSAGGSNLSVGTWYHIALTADGTNTTVYLDGVQDVQIADTNSFTAANMVFGSNTISWVNGRFAALKVWDAALTAAEVKNEVYSILPKRWSGINLWCPMLAGATERLRDYGPNLRSLTAVGTLTDEDGPPAGWGAPVIVLPYAGAASGEVEEGSGTAKGAAATEAAGRVTLAGSGATQGAAATSAAGVVVQGGAGAAEAKASTSSAARVTLGGSGTVEGETATAAEGRVTLAGSGAAEGQAATETTARVVMGGSGAAEGEAVTNASGAAVWGGSGAAAGHAATTCDGRTLFIDCDGLVRGAAVTNAAGVIIHAAAGTADGAAATQAAGSVALGATGAAAGTSSTDAAAALATSGVGAVAATSSTSAGGQLEQNAGGAAAGSGSSETTATLTLAGSGATEGQAATQGAAAAVYAGNGDTTGYAITSADGRTLFIDCTGLAQGAAITSAAGVLIHAATDGVGVAAGGSSPQAAAAVVWMSVGIVRAQAVTAATGNVRRQFGPGAGTIMLLEAGGGRIDLLSTGSGGIVILDAGGGQIEVVEL